MQAFVTALTGENGISVANLWSDLTALVPFIAVIFGFSFGYRLLKKVIKSGSKGKVNI